MRVLYGPLVLVFKTSRYTFPPHAAQEHGAVLDVSACLRAGLALVSYYSYSKRDD